MILCWEIVRGYGLNIPPKVAPATHHLVQDTWTATEKSGHCHGQRCELPQQKVDTATTKSGYCHNKKWILPLPKVSVSTTKSGYCHNKKWILPRMFEKMEEVEGKMLNTERGWRIWTSWTSWTFLWAQTFLISNFCFKRSRYVVLFLFFRSCA